MVGWHYELDGHELEQAPEVGDGQGSLACYSPWGRKESDTTEQLNRTEHHIMTPRGLTEGEGYREIRSGDRKYLLYIFIHNQLIYFLTSVCHHFVRVSQFSSVIQSCLTLCDPMDCSTAGLPVHQQLLEFTQTHVH